MMKYFPLYIDLEDQPILLVGGGERAAQKLRLLLKTQAKIEIIATSFNDELEASGSHKNVTIIKRAFKPNDLHGKRLFYAASENDEENEKLAQIARDAGVLVNAVDAPLHCDFITPAIVERGAVTVAIGTEGKAPILAREIKALLDRLLPANFGRLAEKSRDIRRALKDRITDGRAKLRIFERLMGGSYRDAVLAGDDERAAHLLNTQIEASGLIDGELPGSVSLIGAGPGDPDLLTLKAQQKLQHADVLVIDRLVNSRILDYARRDAKRIYVGKQAGSPSTQQDEINQIIVREALDGARVVRVKGGDPNIFGRAQEELAACQLFGIDVEIVPGISAAQAASASLKLPLTARGKHRSITFLTAATKDMVIADDVAAFMKEGRPFAIYMGVKLASEIVKAMHVSGADMNTDVVIVENASLENERAFATQLCELDSTIISQKINGPAILFIGLSYDEMGLAVDPRVNVILPNNVVPLARRVS